MYDYKVTFSENVSRKAFLAAQEQCGLCRL